MHFYFLITNFFLSFNRRQACLPVGRVDNRLRGCQQKTPLFQAGLKL
jgi:hypothetical protein